MEINVKSLDHTHTLRWSRASDILRFCAAAEPWNLGKSTKPREIHKNTKNTAKFGRILSNTFLYNIFKTYVRYWGYLLAVNLKIHLGTCKQRPETTRRRFCSEKLGTTHDVKGFAIASFLEHIVVKEQMMTSVRKTLKTLVWSAQNRSISSEICLENNHKIGRFLPIAFWWSLHWNLPRNSREIGWFFGEFVPKNPAKFDVFFRDLSEALVFT